MKGKVSAKAMAKGSSMSTGPNEGQGMGPRDGGTPEKTGSRPDRLPSSGLSPSPQVVGSFVTDGPSAKGEATIQKGGAVEQTARQLSQEVEREPLPVEERAQVQRFYDMLLGGKEKPGEQ